MRFCRYCGVPIPQDSHFCPQCGKRLGRQAWPRLEKAAALLKLNTPYPYFAVLLIGAIAFMVLNRKPKFDYSHLDWTFEVSSRTGPDDQGAYRQKLWLIAENTGAQTIQDIPMELHIRTDPPADAPISAWFAGKDFALNQKGRLKPLPVILTDPIQAGAKRRFQFEGTVTAKPPFTVIYEFKDESGKKLLARYAAEP